MKLILVEDGPLVFQSKNGFPVTREEIENATYLSYTFRPDGASIPIDEELANEIPGQLLMQSAVKFDADGKPTLVRESHPEAMKFRNGAVLVSAGYNHMRPHVRFECNHCDLGVIYTYAPPVNDNWSRRSFLAVMVPGTEISFVVQVPVRRLDSSCAEGYCWEQMEEKTALLRLSEETGRIEYLANDVPIMDNGEQDWMKALNRDADDEWKRALYRRRFG